MRRLLTTTLACPPIPEGFFQDQGLWAAYGMGVRWYSPMGPLRFEWGWNLDRPEGQPKQVMEFTIGTAF